jgi:4-hydroxybenzoate polyprenyltransferase
MMENMTKNIIMIHFFKLVRYQNLLMLAFMQLIFRYGFLKWQNVPLSLADWQYFLLVLATVLIAAGGYVINDIFDQNTDSENKPSKVIVGNKISEALAYNLYVGLTIAGVGIGFYLSNVIMKPGFATLFILIASLLYLYATSLKQMILIGNIIVALLLSFSVIIIGIYDLYPATYEGNQKDMGVLFSILLDYAFFAFILNFIREIVKDLEDINGDYNQGMNTLPIVLGVQRTSKVVFVLSFIPLLILLYYTNEYFASNKLYIATVYSLLMLVGPLLYFTIKSSNAKTKKEFHHLSLVLKFVLFFGILSIAVVAYNIKNHA